MLDELELVCRNKHPGALMSRAAHQLDERLTSCFVQSDEGLVGDEQ